MARFSTTLFLVVLLYYVYTAEGSVLRESLNQVGEDGKFDKLALVLTWPPSFCHKMCVKPSSDYRMWKIHGLWPFASGVHSKHIPIYCQGKYDSTLIRGTLRDEMNQKWPNLRGGSNDKFWKHEFKKHGRCPYDLSVFRPQQEYFKDAIHLYDQYDIKTILRNGGVVPSIHDVYTLSQVNSALHKGLGVYPAVYCYEVKSIQYLLEVRMCFDLNLQPITCGDALVGGGRCNPKKGIYYSPTEINVNHHIVTTSEDLAVQFLVNIAEMDARDKMMDEEQDDHAELWENLNQNVHEYTIVDEGRR